MPCSSHGLVSGGSLATVRGYRAGRAGARAAAALVLKTHTNEHGAAFACERAHVASLAALHRAELREGVALGDDELAVLVRDVALDVAGVDEVGEHALDLVVVLVR
eukprot:scaffold14232_cov69-Phaeocystis_antarctica.AAC.3